MNMTREEEIKQKAKEIASNWDDGRGNVFYHRVDMLCNMAQWADAHPKNPTCLNLKCPYRNGELIRTDNSHVIANLQAEIITLKADLESACEQLKMNAEDMYKLHNPWVSVKERLPEDNKTVLVWFGGYYAVALHRDNEWWECTGWQSGSGWSALDKISDIASGFITHWMPIPEFKKGE